MDVLVLAEDYGLCFLDGAIHEVRLNLEEPVARRIRSQPWGKEIVLIALTGWGQDEDRRRSQEAGFDGHLVKPVNYPALLALLGSVGVGK